MTRLLALYDQSCFSNGPEETEARFHFNNLKKPALDANRCKPKSAKFWFLTNVRFIPKVAFVLPYDQWQ